jgi:hypothetical protein
VQEVFEKERETLNAKLQSRPGDSDLGPYCSLLERLEKVIQEQVSSSPSLGPDLPGCAGEGEGMLPM